MDALPPGEALQRLEQRRDAIVEQLAEFEDAPRHVGSYQLLIDHQAHYLRSERNWLDQVMARLRAQLQ